MTASETAKRLMDPIRQPPTAPMGGGFTPTRGRGQPDGGAR